MRRWFALIVAALTILGSTAAWGTPAGWPTPRYRFEHNAPTAAGVELGRQLFYDPQLSADGRIACASCHQQAAAFAHAQHRLSHGIGDQLGTRNAPALFNLAWQPDFMWDGAVTHLELQPLAPLTNAVEMGSRLPDVLARLRADPDYPARFEAAFGTREIDSQRMLRALAQFLGSLVSADSAYDRAQRGQAPLEPDAQRGLAVFRTRCATCHAEPLFTDFSYRDNGLDAAPRDPGRGAISGRDADRGRFRVPSLRNVALTAPYMHDGRFETLDAVLDHYAQGLQASARRDPALARPLAMDDAERRALIAFLRALTDEGFVRDTRFAEPDGVRAQTDSIAAPWRRIATRLFEGLWPAAQARPAPASARAAPVEAPTARVARRLASLEVVAVRDADALRVWVDDDVSNAPRSGLDLRLRTDTRLMRAVEEAPGRYRIPIDESIVPTAATLELRASDGSAQVIDFTLPAAPARPAL